MSGGLNQSRTEEFLILTFGFLCTAGFLVLAFDFFHNTVCFRTA